MICEQMIIVIEGWRYVEKFQIANDIKQTICLLVNELFIFWHLQVQLFVLQQFA